MSKESRFFFAVFGQSNSSGDYFGAEIGFYFRFLGYVCRFPCIRWEVAGFIHKMRKMRKAPLANAWRRPCSVAACLSGACDIYSPPSWHSLLGRKMHCRLRFVLKICSVLENNPQVVRASYRSSGLDVCALDSPPCTRPPACMCLCSSVCDREDQDGWDVECVPRCFSWFSWEFQLLAKISFANSFGIGEAL